ncbi:MAG TPA: ABC transporter transmembrane domain-containing protein, partial [Microbacteriaceae bacterium]
MRRLLSLGVPSDAGFKLGMFMTALQALSTIALMLTSAFLISYSSEQPPILYLMLAVVGVRAFALGRAVFRYAERWFLHNSVFKMMSALRPKLFQALVPFAPGGLRGVRSGDQLSRFNSDVENLQNLALRVIGPVFQSLFALILATGFLMFVDLASALALFLVGLIAIFVALVVSYALSAKENSSLAEIKSDLENSLV